MADLFVCSTDNISLHLKNIFNEEELEEKSNYRGFLGSSKRRNKERYTKIKLRAQPDWAAHYFRTGAL